MKLSNKAIELLKTNTDVRMDFARAIGITESSLIKAIKRESGSLTRYAGIQVLKNVGLTEEEILENDNVLS